MLVEELKNQIDPDWVSGHKPIYKIVDRLIPHCEKSESYRQIGGIMRYRCRHLIVRCKTREKLSSNSNAPPE